MQPAGLWGGRARRRRRRQSVGRGTPSCRAGSIRQLQLVAVRRHLLWIVNTGCDLLRLIAAYCPESIFKCLRARVRTDNPSQKHKAVRTGARANTHTPADLVQEHGAQGPEARQQGATSRNKPQHAAISCNSPKWPRGKTARRANDDRARMDALQRI